MNFFDNCFFFIHRFYSGFNKEKNPASTAATVVGGIQSFNLVTIIMLIALKRHSKEIFSQVWIFILIAVVLQVINYIRYIYKDKRTIEIIESGNIKFNNPKKSHVALLYFGYMALSFISFVALAVYLGMKTF